MSDERKQTGTVRTETYWALVDTLYEARIENHEKATRIAELEGLLRSCRHMLNEHGRVDQKTITLIVDRGRYQHLQREISAALTPEEPK